MLGDLKALEPGKTFTSSDWGQVEMMGDKLLRMVPRPFLYTFLSDCRTIQFARLMLQPNGLYVERYPCFHFYDPVARKMPSLGLRQLLQFLSTPCDELGMMPRFINPTNGARMNMIRMLGRGASATVVEVKCSKTKYVHFTCAYVWHNYI